MAACDAGTLTRRLINPIGESSGRQQIGKVFGIARDHDMLACQRHCCNHHVGVTFFGFEFF